MPQVASDSTHCKPSDEGKTNQLICAVALFLVSADTISLQTILKQEGHMIHERYIQIASGQAPQHAVTQQ